MMTPSDLTVELQRRLDGPHADEHTTAAADLAAEAVRFLNYATGSHAPHGLTYPATVYTITADLALAADRMPQLFDQLAAWLTAEEAAGRLAMDDRTPARVAVVNATTRLDIARALAMRLAALLSDVQQSIAALNGNGPARGGAR